MNDKTVVDVQRFIDEQRFGGFQWLIFAMCFTIVLLDGFDTAAIGFVAPSLLVEWQLGKAALAPVLSAALFGLACGALVSGPLSDRWGRRKVLVTSVVLFGVACVASASSASLGSLTVFRFATGIGLGAAMPNAVTLMSEFCPQRRRATIVNLMFCGFPLGAALGGFLAAWMIPQFGWRSVLLLGGVVPLLLGVVLLWRLPESVRFMVVKRQPADAVRAVLARISRGAHDAQAFVVGEAAPQGAATGSGNSSGGKSGARLVLSRPYRLGSLMLWLTYFMGLVIFYGLVNWMPVLLRDAGLAARQAALVSALFPLGGAGAVLCGMLMDRFEANRVVALCYGLGALGVYAIGQALGNFGLLVVAIFVTGVLMNTAQASMPVLAATFYPTEGRGTGVAWMLGVGRFGGIAGSFLVAELARRQISLTGIFSVVAVAGAVACIALLIKQVSHGNAAAVRVSGGEPVGH
ncbi:aromatic acid/H+ symport family MFS transporter [Paraburkholderia jirisanensis]